MTGSILGRGSASEYPRECNSARNKQERAWLSTSRSHETLCLEFSRVAISHKRSLVRNMSDDFFIKAIRPANAVHHRGELEKKTRHIVRLNIIRPWRINAWRVNDRAPGRSSWDYYILRSIYTIRYFNTASRNITHIQWCFSFMKHFAFCRLILNQKLE